MSENPGYLLRAIRPADLSQLLPLLHAHALYEGETLDAAGLLPRLEAALFQSPPKLFCEVVARAAAPVEPGAAPQERSAEGIQHTADPAEQNAELVGDLAGELVGYTTWTIDFSTWAGAPFLYMDCLYLAEPVRGLGLGAAILHRLRQHALAAGCANIQWQTPASNTRAIRFYQRNGAILKEKARFTLK